MTDLLWDNKSLLPCQNSLHTQFDSKRSLYRPNHNLIEQNVHNTMNSLYDKWLTFINDLSGTNSLLQSPSRHGLDLPSGSSVLHCSVWRHNVQSMTGEGARYMSKLSLFSSPKMTCGFNISFNKFNSGLNVMSFICAINGRWNW